MFSFFLKVGVRKWLKKRNVLKMTHSINIFWDILSLSILIYSDRDKFRSFYNITTKKIVIWRVLDCTHCFRNKIWSCQHFSECLFLSHFSQHCREIFFKNSYTFNSGIAILINWFISTDNMANLTRDLSQNTLL